MGAAKPVQYKHAFLVPLLVLDEQFSQQLIHYANELPGCLFIVSIQNPCSDVNNLRACSNVKIFSPDLEMPRLSHWEYVVSLAKGFELNTFSFLFSGDKIDCKAFSQVHLRNDVDLFFNSYLLEKESTVCLKKDYIFLGDTKLNLALHALFGMPSYAPLQKIIFSSSTKNFISFSRGNNYISDQVMIRDLLVKFNFRASYLNLPFYRLVLKNRKLEGDVRFLGRLKAGLALYRGGFLLLGMVAYTLVGVAKLIVSRLK